MSAEPTRPPPANFDGLARNYRALETLAFGRDLERARFRLLDRLAACRSILVLGEGDGRCLERLAGIAPDARVHCVDASGAMIARAAARMARTGAGARVAFEKADARFVELQPGRYDGVVTLFFLDCFREDEVAGLVGRIGPAVAPGALWLFADFALPPSGAARLRARAWLAVLYAFFRWRTGLSARRLPDSERLIEAAGWERSSSVDLRGGLLRAVLFRKAS
jgi:predicted O-methyltransferase YrrM